MSTAFLQRNHHFTISDFQAMDPPQPKKQLSDNRQINLAFQTLKRNLKLYIRSAAKICSVSHTTSDNRKRGRFLRRNI